MAAVSTPFLKGGVQAMVEITYLIAFAVVIVALTELVKNIKK